MTAAFDVEHVAGELSVGDVRYVDQVLRLAAGTTSASRSPSSRSSRTRVQPDRLAWVLGYSQGREGVNGDPGFRRYPARFGWGPRLGWAPGGDAGTIQGQWCLGPNGLVGRFTPAGGETLAEVAERARLAIGDREEMQTYRAEHRQRRGGPEAVAAKLAEDDAITSAAAARDPAIERLTAALGASSRPERRLAELAGLAGATVRRIIGR